MKVPKVTVREKVLTGGRLALYLDYYPPVLIGGKRSRRETLGLTVYAKPKTDLQRNENKDARMQADFRRASRQKELNANPGVNLLTGKDKQDFIAFYKTIVTEKAERIQNPKGWKASIVHFEQFAGSKLFFTDITLEFAESYRDHLKYKAKVKNKKIEANISRNTAKLYFEYFQTVVLEGVKTHRLTTNPLENIEPIKAVKSHKEFLTIEEMQRLAKTEYKLPDVIRRAALFSGLTGLRFIDIQRLQWSNVRQSEGDILLVLRIKKVDEPTTHYISEEAFELLGVAGPAEQKIFQGLRYSSELNDYLDRWTTEAGIERRVTFHTFRHSFASAHLRSGTSVEEISELLSHTNIRTTQIYLHGLGHRKRALANKISLKG